MATVAKADGRKKDYVPITSFQRWLKPLLEANARDGKTPSDYVELHRMLVQRGADVSENTMYRVVRGNTPNSGIPEYNLTWQIGEIMGDLKGALDSRGFFNDQRGKSATPTPDLRTARGQIVQVLTPSDFVGIPVLGVASASAPGAGGISSARADSARMGEQMIGITMENSDLESLGILEGDYITFALTSKASTDDVVAVKDSDGTVSICKMSDAKAKSDVIGVKVALIRR